MLEQIWAEVEAQVPSQEKARGKLVQAQVQVLLEGVVLDIRNRSSFRPVKEEQVSHKQRGGVRTNNPPNHQMTTSICCIERDHNDFHWLICCCRNESCFWYHSVGSHKERRRFGLYNLFKCNKINM